MTSAAHTVPCTRRGAYTRGKEGRGPCACVVVYENCYFLLLECARSEMVGANGHAHVCAALPSGIATLIIFSEPTPAKSAAPLGLKSACEGSDPRTETRKQNKPSLRPQVWLQGRLPISCESRVNI